MSGICNNFISNFANVWISFKEVGLKDIRIPEPRAKKIVKNIQDNNSELKIIYKLRNSSLIQDIREVKFSDKLPKNIEPVNLDKRCEFKSQKVKCFFGNWEAGYRENFEIFVKDVKNNAINSIVINVLYKNFKIFTITCFPISKETFNFL